MFEVFINEDIEIASTFLFFLQPKEKSSAIIEYEFMYIPRMKEELNFVLDTSAFLLTNKYVKKYGIQNLYIFLFSKICIDGYVVSIEQQDVLDSYSAIKKNKKWIAWWKAWNGNFNELCKKITELLNIIQKENEILYSDNYTVILPLILSMDKISALYYFDSNRYIIMSNFGFSFEELFMGFSADIDITKSSFILSMFSDIKYIESLRGREKVAITYYQSSININKYIKNKKHIDSCLYKTVNWYNYIISNDKKIVGTNINKYNNEITFQKNNDFPSSLEQLMYKNNVLFLGEVHGMKEHEKFLCDNVTKLYEMNYRVFLLEISIDMQKFLDDYLFYKVDKLDSSICMMRELIDKIKTFNATVDNPIKVFCVDEPIGEKFNTAIFNIEKREEKMANNILDVINNTEMKVIGVFGNYHVQKNKVFLFQRNESKITLYKTVVSKTNKKILSINVFGLNGQEKGPFNCRIRKKIYLKSEMSKNLYSLLEEKAADSIYFDYDKWFFKKYPFLMSATAPVCVLNKREMPVDGSFIFKSQTVADWEDIYEK